MNESRWIKPSSKRITTNRNKWKWVKVNENESKLKNRSDTFKSNISSQNTKNRSKIIREEEPIDVEPLDKSSIQQSKDSLSNGKELSEIEDPWWLI